MQEPDFFSFLTRSMSILRSEAPAHYESLSYDTGGVLTRLTADGVCMDASFDGSAFNLNRPVGLCDVEVAIDSGTILKLIDGIVTLEESILCDAVWIRGPVEIVEQLYSGILVYVDGSLRSPSYPKLLARFREWSCADIIGS